MINITNAALNKLISLRPEINSTLRISVIGAGCSGLSYKLEWVKTIETTEKDKMFSINGLVYVIDPKSYLFLKGLTLDFTDGLNGTGFVFNNPNAKRTCGCGTSFST
jgi:iron-sulfur cluster assembly protein